MGEDRTHDNGDSGGDDSRGGHGGGARGGTEPEVIWHTVVSGRRVDLPATLPTIRAALTADQAADLDAEIARTPALDLPLVLARWALAPTDAAAEDEAVFARLATGDFSDCVAASTDEPRPGHDPRPDAS
ncbi:hypothetical protein ACFYVL_27315 [Streptomyces sp. NPDC004111]|uniref:hypothetical protein n=1 Tax=Streptomyces sp. NPDC004111 TaxID=3364690 RepID=UPI00369E94F4